MHETAVGKAGMTDDQLRIGGIFGCGEHPDNLSPVVLKDQGQVAEAVTVVGDETARMKHGAIDRPLDEIIPPPGEPGLIAPDSGDRDSLLSNGYAHNVETFAPTRGDRWASSRRS
jgi:hypothetical protein